MIPKPLDQIDGTVLQALIDNAVAERKTIEYKSTLPGNSDSDRKEFLADVSSFANTAGGDLVYGIEEQAGLPVKISGMAVADPDLEKRVLENLIRDGLDPRIRYEIADVSVQTGKVVIFRIEQSWVRPHRVILKGHDKFYGRNSTGKYPLDVDELRAAFVGSETLAERIRSFRIDRLIAISGNEMSAGFKAGPKVVLHCLPLESFGGRKAVDFLQFLGDTPEFTMDLGDWSRWRINLEGIACETGTGPEVCGCVQFFRNGIIEAVDGLILGGAAGARSAIPSGTLEERVIGCLALCLPVLKRLGVSPPIFLGLSLTGIKGFRLRTPVEPYQSAPILTDRLVLPEVSVENLEQRADSALRPQLDTFWNAFGYPGSPSYDSSGHWRRRR